MSVAVQSVAQDEGKLPSVVVSLIVLPPLVRLLPFASFACTVIVVVVEPLAVIDDGLAAIVDVAVETAPGAKVTLPVFVIDDAPILPLIVTACAMVEEVRVRV